MVMVFRCWHGLWDALEIAEEKSAVVAEKESLLIESPVVVKEYCRPFPSVYG
jgi:hypothetical protein